MFQSCIACFSFNRNQAQHHCQWPKIHINFHIPHTKTKDTGEDINIMDSTCPCSATSTLEHHLSSNIAIPKSAPLFTLETADGQWAPMKHTWFMARCNAIWEKDGLTSVKGHGF